MKRILLLFLAIFLITPQHTKAQRGEGVAAAIGAAAAIGTAIAAVEQIKEELELFATEFVMENYNYEAFELKVDGLGDKSTSLDPSTVSILVFSFSELDKTNRAPVMGGRMSLIVFLDSGWRNEFGIDITRVKFIPFTKETWNPIYLKYLSIATGKIIESELIPIYSEDTEQKTTDYIEVKGEKCFNTLKTKSIQFTTLTNKGVKSAGSIILPFYSLSGDTYIVDNFSENYKIVFNEKSLGLYLKDLGKLVQLKSSLVSDITFYLNSF